MKKLVFILFAGLLFSAKASAGIILGNACNTIDVTAGGATADDCIGLLDKTQPGAGPNDSESFLNNAQTFSDGSGDIWDASGAFGINTWNFLGKDDQSSWSFINATSGDPATWTLDSSVSGDILIAVKQTTELGLWFFDDASNVTDGTIDIATIFGTGKITDDGWSHVSIYSSASNVPEPSMVGLLAIGLIGLAVARRRMR